MKATTVLLALCAAGPALAACAESKLEPQIASSATLPGYASRYPSELAMARSAFTAQEEEAKRLTGEFASYPDKLSEPGWAAVSDVYDLADTDGRSYAYVERLEQSQGAAAFFVDQKDELGKKVGGAAQYAAKEKQCDVDVASPARFALDKGFEKQLTDSIHDRSDAHKAIDSSEDALGKKNVETLKTQADAISRASYVAHVGIVRAKQRVDRMVEDAAEVRKTLDRTIEDLNKVVQDPKASDARKKLAEKDLVDAHAARSLIDTEVTQAQNVQKSTEEGVKQLRKDYADAFAALKEKVKQRIK